MAIKWLTGYPRIVTNTTGTTVTASGQINQSGSIRMVIIPVASGVPLPTGIWAGKNASGYLLPKSRRDNEAALVSGHGVNLTGYALTPETAYKMCFVASGYATHDLSSGYVIAFTPPDVTAPSWVTTYPYTEGVVGTSGRIVMRINEAGSGFFVVQPRADAAPTVAQILAGKNSAGSTLVQGKKGTVTFTTGATICSGVMSGLVGDTLYTVYTVAKDDTYYNVQASGYHKDFATTDVIAPIWIAGYPHLESVSSSGVMISTKLNDTGSGYCLILADGAHVPSSGDIKNSGTCFAIAFNTTVDFYSGGLSQDTAYDAYLIAEDPHGNTQLSGYRIDFTTSDITAPKWVGIYPTTSGVTGGSGLIKLAINESGTGYWVVQPSTLSAPSSAQIIAGQNSAGVVQAAGLKGNGIFESSGLVYTGLMYGASSVPTYKVYSVAQDEDGNVMASGWAKTFSAPPRWRAGYPNVTVVGTTSGIVKQSITETGSGYWVVVPATSGVPSATQIKSGRGSSGDLRPQGRRGGSVITASGIIYSGVISGLAYSTAYRIYSVAESDDDNLQVTGYMTSFNTDTTLPAWMTGYPAVSAITAHTATVSFKLNDAGSGYFVLVDHTDGAPSATQIRAGQNCNSTAVATGLSGRKALVSGVVATVVASGLAYSKVYKIYSTAQDDAKTSTAAVVSATVRAQVPKIAPPGRYSMSRIVKERRKLANQIYNTLRG